MTQLMKHVRDTLFWLLSRRTESTTTTNEQADPVYDFDNQAATEASGATTVLSLMAALEPIIGFVPEVRRFMLGLDPLAKEINQYQKEIRATAMFIIDIAQVTTKKAFFCRVFSYIDSLCPKITGDVLKLNLRAEFGNTELDSQAGADWVDQVKWALSNWKMAVSSPLRKSLHKLAGFLAWAVISTQVPEGTFAKGFGSLYESSGLNKLDALDFPTHVLECFITVFSNLREAVQSGRFMAAFGQDALVTRQLEHARLMALVTSFMLGTLEQEQQPTTRQQYLRDIAVHVEKLQEQVKITKGAVNQTFAKMLQQAQARHAEVLAFNRASFARMTAFALCLWGGSSVAKSTLLPIIITSLLRANGYVEAEGGTDPFLVGTHNATDKYHSGLKASDLVTVLDDLGNTQPQHTEGDPSSILLDAVNTAPRLMNKAEVEQKGKVPFQAPFVIVTTNDKTMGAADYSVNPTSRLRRIRYYVEVLVREEFRMDNTAMLDPTKVPAGDPNFWRFNVTSYTPLPGGRPGTAEPSNWKPVSHQFDGVGEAVILTGIGIADLLAFFQETSRSHFELEQRLMRQNNDYHRRSSCSHGGLGGILCRQCTRAELSQQGLFDFIRNHTTRVFVDPPIPTVMFDPVADDPPTHPLDVVAWNQLRSCQLAAAEQMRNLVTESRRLSGELYGAATTEPYQFRFLHWSLAKLGVTGGKWLIASPIAYVSTAYIYTFVWVWLFLWYASRQFMSAQVAAVLSLIIPFLMILGNRRSVFGYVWSNMDLIAISMAKREAQKFWRARGRRLTLIIAGLTCTYYLYKFVMQLWRSVASSGSEPISVPVPERQQLAHQGGVLTTPSVPETITRPWQERMVEAVPVGGVAKTMSCAQGLERIRHSLAWGVFLGPEQNGVRKRLQVDVLGIECGLYLVPTHVRRKLHGGVIDVTLSFADGSVGGTTFKAQIADRSWQDIPDTDLSLVDIPVGRMVRCNMDLFPLALPTRNLPVRSIHRNADGVLAHCSMYASASHVSMPETAVDTAALEYCYDSPTGPGLCGMLLFADTQPTFIAGIHIAGENGFTRGVAACLTRQQVTSAKVALRAEGVVPIMPKFLQVDLSLNGVVKLHPSDIVLPKSLNQHLAPSSEYTYLGAHTKGSRSFHSTIAETRCAGLVAEIFPDAACVFGPPRNLSNARTWTYNVDLAAHPASIPPDICALAEQDYRLHWERVFKSHPGFEKELGVVDDSTAINGINGVNELTPIDMSTSQGWPVNRPKTELFFKPGVPTKLVVDPWEATPQFYVDARKLEDHLAGGHYVPFIFRASLKDEPTKKTKEWPRMFCGAPVMYTFLMRKYFCLIFAWLKRHKFAFGGMCGINAYSMDWDFLAKFVTSFGADRLVAGDFAHFDKKAMRPVIRFLLSMIMWVAQFSGVYSARELAIMEALLGALTWVIVEVNGEYLLLGGNPSGHIITVELNDFINGFELRCVFYALLRNMEEQSRPKIKDVQLENWAPRDVCHGFNIMQPLDSSEVVLAGVDALFSAFVRLVTYGDDNLFGVAGNCEFFNHTSIADTFALWGITYTMADKLAVSVPYQSIEQVTFLKRGFRLDPRDKCYKAPLEKLSMVKALMVRNTKSALSHDEHIAVNVENCLREAYFYGEAEYPAWHAWCTDLVTRLDLWHHFSTTTLPNYDFWQCWWEENHGPQKLSSQSLEDDLGIDSGEEEIATLDSELGSPGDEWPATLRHQLLRWDGRTMRLRGSRAVRLSGSHTYAVGTWVNQEFDGPITHAIRTLPVTQALVLQNHAGLPRVIILQLSRPMHPHDVLRGFRESHWLWSDFTMGPFHTPHNGQSPGSFTMTTTAFLQTMRYQRGVMYRTDGRVFHFSWPDMTPWHDLYLAPINMGGDLAVDISEEGSSGPNTA